MPLLLLECSTTLHTVILSLTYLSKHVYLVSESNGIQCSASHFIVPIDGGGGPIAVVPLDQPIGERRFSLEKTLVFHNTHSGAVVDTDFSPFRDNVFATAGEDSLIRIWQIPEEGIERDSHLAELAGHQKKINSIRFHPCAAHVMASGGADQSIRGWDIAAAKELFSLENDHTQQVVEVVWDYFGRTIASSCKDKNLRIFDPRTVSVIHTFNTAHEGNKSMKLTFLGDSELLLSTGFTKMSTRQFKMWDVRNTKQEVSKVDLDQAAGVIMPFFDSDSCILYLGGKGDGNIRYYELAAGTLHPLAEYKSSVPQKGLGMVPKRGLNVNACETARFLKTSANNTIEPLSFIVPRKSEAFQDDIFPDTLGTEPSITTNEWLNGSDRSPKRISLNPNIDSLRINHSPLFGELPDAAPVAQLSIPVSRGESPHPPMADGNGELQAALLKISELEEKLSSTAETNKDDFNISRISELEATVQKLESALAEALAQLGKVEAERDSALARLEGLKTDGPQSPTTEIPVGSIAEGDVGVTDDIGQATLVETAKGEDDTTEATEMEPL